VRLLSICFLAFVCFFVYLCGCELDVYTCVCGRACECVCVCVLYG